MLCSTRPSPQPKWHLHRFSRFTQLMAECPQACRGMSCPLKIALLHRGIRSPFNTWFLEPTIAHNRNIISIGSAVFCTAHGRWHARECPFPLKLPLRMGICIPCNTCFVYHEIQPNIFQSINIFYRILVPGYVSKV